MTMVEALNLALRQEMEKDDSVVLLGQDVGPDGGVFRVTDHLIDRFGSDRVVDTPLAESAIVGMSVGMAIYGLKPVCEIQFSGFSYQNFHQLENHAARMRWRTRGRLTVPMVMRAPYGGGVRALEHHCESREAYWAHTPGLKLVIPSGPRNARALLVSAIRDPDPVIFYEAKALYRAFREEVPEAEESLPIGKANIVRAGDDLTIITYGAMLRPALEAAEELQIKEGIEAEVIDLLTLSPLDESLMITSVKKTGRAVIVHEAPRSYGPGAEIVTRLLEGAFYYLEAPIARVTGFDL
ncbi:MAG: alpha-ketoacid dehydrogenase subunit beta, partial [Candidatus Thiodiazotropha sp. (ex Rostrolucina anterorostrata)]|nr:alpha-ketoacid dehydrogenase subunit beta [Candidatus Thiodiazotropha sp. (ex Rostrolucina anterorostrata)]